MFMIAMYTLKTYIKNPTKALALKRELLALRDAINLCFPDE